MVAGIRKQGVQGSEGASRPRIGITYSRERPADYYDAYARAVESAGGEPVLLSTQARALEGVDGLLLPGGLDVDPALYGEQPGPDLGDVDRELDDAEIRLFNQARAARLPVLGICRGQQVINVALGGSLHQHIDEHEVRQHGRAHLAHPVELVEDSEIGRSAGAPTVEVNSLHHQSVKDLAPGLRVTARGPDGVIEGLESDDGLVVAIQCHPEELTGQLSWASSLFERFVARTREGSVRRAR